MLLGLPIFHVSLQGDRSIACIVNSFVLKDRETDYCIGCRAKTEVKTVPSRESFIKEVKRALKNNETVPSDLRIFTYLILRSAILPHSRNEK